VEASYVFRKAGVLDVVHSYPCMILKIAGWIHSAIAPQINIFTQAKVNLSKMYMNHIIMFITLAYNELGATSEENCISRRFIQLRWQVLQCLLSIYWLDVEANVCVFFVFNILVISPHLSTYYILKSEYLSHLIII